MRSYLDLVEEKYLNSIGWDPEDSYSQFALNSNNVLDFNIPSHFKMHASSQTTDRTFTDHTLASSSLLTGSVSYLFSTIPFKCNPSSSIPLNCLTQCYKPVYKTAKDLKSPFASMIFGRMHFPGQQLEAMYIQGLGQISAITRWVVDPRLETPLILTSTIQSRSNKWSREFIYSTHENLFGLRALANLCSWEEKNTESRLVNWPRISPGNHDASSSSPDELSGTGESDTVSSVTSSAIPLTLSLVTNPLMGSISVAYSLQPTPLLALATRFDYNLYSYLSDLTLGCELWRTTPISLSSEISDDRRDGPISVFKVSTSLASQTAQILWEGSVHDFIVSVGLKFCYSDSSAPAQTGIEITYSV
ncbi:Mdm10 protein [Starmerella bacillaris]|uniref:Mitochondrial distribution and morphology protein 10 n=1 Tax=Starmerella bacillaris TaxID=1247836 RepID=A0AAV5RQZ3_STABA|nr:Mdm10 protein [Starmerella bacillaris]